MKEKFVFFLKSRLFLLWYYMNYILCENRQNFFCTFYWGDHICIIGNIRINKAWIITVIISADSRGKKKKKKKKRDSVFQILMQMLSLIALCVYASFCHWSSWQYWFTGRKRRRLRKYCEIIAWFNWYNVTLDTWEHLYRAPFTQQTFRNA